MFTEGQLTSPDFDEVVYLRHALRASSYASEHARLMHCITQVRGDTQSILTNHADELIVQARCTHRAQREVASVRQCTDSLQKATGRLRRMIEEPYLQLQGRVRELEAAQEASQLLQSTLRFLSLTSRLQEQLAATPSVDVIRASHTLQELEEALREDAIQSLKVVETQLPMVERHATTIRGKTHDLLSMTELTAPASSAGNVVANNSSAATLSRLASNVSTGLQCAYVLRMLSRTVHSFMTERRREVLRTVMRELDPQTIEEHVSAEYDRLSQTTPPPTRASPQPTMHGGSGSGGGMLSEQAVTANVVLERVQKTLYTAVQHTQCVLLLWRLLLQKRDPQTQAPYLLSVESPVQVLVEYWTAITDKLRERLSSLQRRHAVRLALATAYPRFHYLIASFLSHTDTSGEGPSAGAGGGIVQGASYGPGSGLGSSSSGGATAGVTGYTTSIHVTQCGMGDFLDLIDVVESALHYSNDSSDGGLEADKTESTTVRINTQDVRQSWAVQVTSEVRDAFRAHVMDRHREQISAVLARLAAVTPPAPTMASQAASVAPVRMQGARRPPIPVEANAVDLGAYTRMITHEAQVFRQDPHTLVVLLDCILESLQQLRSNFGAVIRRFPLPPLPAVTAAPTVGQLLHLCIANGCTTLVYDATAVLACVPQLPTEWCGEENSAGALTGSTARAASANVRGGRHRDAQTAVLEELTEQRLKLQQLLSSFQEITMAATHPFADSATAVLVPTLTHVTDHVLRGEDAAARAGRVGGSMSSQENRGTLLQLQSQCRQFTDRFLFLVDSRAAGWAEACQNLTEALLTRLLCRVALTTHSGLTALPTTPADAVKGLAGYARTLEAVLTALLPFIQVILSVGVVGRTTSVLRGCIRQMGAFYDACATGAPVPAMIERLRAPVPRLLAQVVLVQFAQLSVTAAAAAAMPPLVEAMGSSEQDALVLLEPLVLEACRRCAEAPGSRTATTEEEDNAGKDSGAEAESMVARCFRDVSGAAVPELKTRLQTLWNAVVAA